MEHPAERHVYDHLGAVSCSNLSVTQIVLSYLLWVSFVVVHRREPRDLRYSALDAIEYLQTTMRTLVRCENQGATWYLRCDLLHGLAALRGYAIDPLARSQAFGVLRA